MLIVDYIYSLLKTEKSLLRWVGWALEHVKHALRNGEATADVDRRDEGGAQCECLRGRLRRQATAHEAQRAGSGDARDRVRDRHQRRM